MSDQGKKPLTDTGVGYFRTAEAPYHSLLFVLPLIAAYEVGIRHLAGSASLGGDPGTHPQIVAFTLMQRFFVWFGATGAMLPALSVVGILLAWHVARKDAWKIRPLVLGGMAVESVLLAIPLIGVGFAVANHMALWAFPAPDPATLKLLVLSCGAGVYEEAVFRLGAMTLLSFLLCDVLRIPSRVGLVLVVMVSSVLFALYHYWGSELFTWRSMVFRTIAGVYFALLFLTRGFGITAGAHAAYDIFVVSMRQFVADT